MRTIWLTLVVLGMLGAAAPVLAGSDGPTAMDRAFPEGAPAWAAYLVPDPNDPAFTAYREQQKHRVEVERELNRIRARHFGSMRNEEVRQAGLFKLREFADDVAIYPTLLKVFSKREKMDVRNVVLDIFAEYDGEEGAAMLAWAAVFDDDEEFRAEATSRLQARVEERGFTPERVKLVIDHALRGQKDRPAVAAAQLVRTLGLWEAIPRLITAQVSTPPTGTGPDGDVAFIMIATQRSFVSDLNPVVGTNSVAFDPQLSTLTTGTVLRVIDAMVITYRTEIHRVLVSMTSDLSEQDTAWLGWDIPKWREHWKAELKPLAEARMAERHEKFADETLDPFPGDEEEAGK